jgi:uncharacterized protein (TIGR01732 family)
MSIFLKKGQLPLHKILICIGYKYQIGKEGLLMSHGFGGMNNGFILLVVLFVLLIIVGNSYPIASGGGVY